MSASLFNVHISTDSSAVRRLRCLLACAHDEYSSVRRQAPNNSHLSPAFSLLLNSHFCFLKENNSLSLF